MIQHLPSLFDDKFDVNSIYGTSLYPPRSLIHRLDELSTIWFQKHYFDIRMKIIHECGVAWDTNEQ